MNLLKKRFARVLAGEEDNQADLAELALLANELLAVSSDPSGADVASEASARARKQIKHLVAGAQQEVSGAAAVAEAAAALVAYLGQSIGFAGNADNYYSANNSDLGWVLAERRGIPITLAIVYICVGRALGLDVRGIGFPGHFLVGVYGVVSDQGPDWQTGVQLSDPFNARLVSPDECMQTLARLQGAPLSSEPVAVDDALFVASTPQQIILRVLENLKQIHLRESATGPALAALELQILAAPDSFELRAQQEALVGQVFGRPSGPGGGPEVH